MAENGAISLNLSFCHPLALLGVLILYGVLPRVPPLTRLHSGLLAGFFGLQAVAQDAKAGFDPDEDDIDRQHLAMWSDIYRKMDVHTASEDGDHPLAWKQASIPVQPHFAVKDYLCHMQKHQAICNVDRKTYAGALVDMRFSRLRSLVDVLATIHYNTRQNMLGSARWDDEKSGALAAALVVCQFDALCHCSNMTTNSLQGKRIGEYDTSLCHNSILYINNIEL